MKSFLCGMSSFPVMRFICLSHDVFPLLPPPPNDLGAEEASSVSLLPRMRVTQETFGLKSASSLDVVG